MTGRARVLLFAAPLLLAPLDAISDDPLDKTAEAAPIPEEGSTTIGGARFVAKIEARANKSVTVSLRSFNPGNGEIKTSVKVAVVEMGAADPGSRMEPEMKTVGQRTLPVELKAGANQGQVLVLKTRLSAARAGYLIKRNRLFVEVMDPTEAHGLAMLGR